jgi:hypothetical protein
MSEDCSRSAARSDPLAASPTASGSTTYMGRSAAIARRPGGEQFGLYPAIEINLHLMVFTQLSDGVGGA